MLRVASQNVRLSTLHSRRSTFLPGIWGSPPLPEWLRFPLHGTRSRWTAELCRLAAGPCAIGDWIGGGCVRLSAAAGPKHPLARPGRGPACGDRPGNGRTRRLGRTAAARKTVSRQADPLLLGRGGLAEVFGHVRGRGPTAGAVAGTAGNGGDGNCRRADVGPRRRMAGGDLLRHHGAARRLDPGGRPQRRLGPLGCLRDAAALGSRADDFAARGESPRRSAPASFSDWPC